MNDFNASQIVLASRPSGRPMAGNFRLEAYEEIGALSLTVRSAIRRTSLMDSKMPRRD